MVASHSKKRPNNLVMGRFFNYQILDMIELGVLDYKSIDSFKSMKVFPLFSAFRVEPGRPEAHVPVPKRLMAVFGATYVAEESDFGLLPRRGSGHRQPHRTQLRDFRHGDRRRDAGEAGGVVPRVLWVRRREFMGSDRAEASGRRDSARRSGADGAVDRLRDPTRAREHDGAEEALADPAEGDQASEGEECDAERVRREDWTAAHDQAGGGQDAGPQDKGAEDSEEGEGEEGDRGSEVI